MRLHQIALALTLLSPFAGATPLWSQGLHPSEVVAGNLRTGWRAENGTRIVGLHLKLAPDWMTYWRHPGESGIAPDLDWSASGNLAQVRVHWPEPRLYLKAGYNSIGYKDEVIIPLELTPRDPSQPIALNANLHIGVCADICIPVDMTFRADLADAGAADGRIADILRARPDMASQNGLDDISCDLHPQPKGAMLEVHLDLPEMGQREFVLIELAGAQGRVMPSHREGETLVGQTFLRARDGRLPAIDRSRIALTVISENGALHHNGCSLR